MLHLRWARRPPSVPATTDVALADIANLIFNLAEQMQAHGALAVAELGLASAQSAGSPGRRSPKSLRRQLGGCVAITVMQHQLAAASRAPGSLEAHGSADQMKRVSDAYPTSRTRRCRCACRGKGFGRPASQPVT